MREGDPPQLEGDTAARLLIIFADREENGASRDHWAAGAFNGQVARLLGTGKPL